MPELPRLSDLFRHGDQPENPSRDEAERQACQRDSPDPLTPGRPKQKSRSCSGSTPRTQVCDEACVSFVLQTEMKREEDDQSHRDDVVRNDRRYCEKRQRIYERQIDSGSQMQEGVGARGADDKCRTLAESHGLSAPVFRFRMIKDASRGL